MSKVELVLDTNAWLDLLVFDDLTVRPLRIAIINQQITVWINTCCYEELAQVLNYAQFKWTDSQQKQALSWVQAHSSFFDKVPNVSSFPALPICKDHDDQKFIELAYCCQAQFLISKDKALLKLSARMQREFSIAILTPQIFCAKFFQHDQNK